MAAFFGDKAKFAEKTVYMGNGILLWHDALWMKYGSVIAERMYGE